MYLAKSATEIAQLYLDDTKRSPLLRRKEVVKTIMDMPVCPKCNHPMIEDRGWQEHGIAQCVTPGCGWHGPTDKSMTVADLLFGKGW